MTRIPVRQTLWIAALALMAGCGAISKASAPLDAYTLSPLPVSTPARATSRHLVVELPTSSGALATDRILIKPNPLQAQYLPKGQWVEPAPMLLQNLLVASLQNSGAFRLVGRDGAGEWREPMANSSALGAPGQCQQRHHPFGLVDQQQDVR